MLIIAEHFAVHGTVIAFLVQIRSVGCKSFDLNTQPFPLRDDHSYKLQNLSSLREFKFVQMKIYCSK